MGRASNRKWVTRARAFVHPKTTASKLWLRELFGTVGTFQRAVAREVLCPAPAKPKVSGRLSNSPQAIARRLAKSLGLWR